MLGEQTFSEVLHQQRVERSDTVEIGRWVVGPAYRANGRLGTQLAAAAATLATTLGNGSVTCRGMVMCSVGTGDHQDLLLAHNGLVAVPVAQLIRCDDFNDEVRMMYCIGSDDLNPRFRRIMDEMATELGLMPNPRTALTTHRAKR
jgi:hypothetical protein